MSNRATYEAALLNLRTQARAFTEAFGAAAAAARAFDPRGDSVADPLATQIFREVAELLHTSAVFIPGARELYVLALSPPEKR